MITPQTVHQIKDEGMPVVPKSVAAKENGEINQEEFDNHLAPLRKYPKGTLFVRFDIEFPANLSFEKKARIVEQLHLNSQK